MIECLSVEKVEGLKQPYATHFIETCNYLEEGELLKTLCCLLSADYQGLTKSFSHGVIYCSLITAKLVNLKLGIPWANIQVLPLREKINIAGTNVTCFDANHCPGAIIILFEPPNGKVCTKTLEKHLFKF